MKSFWLLLLVGLAAFVGSAEASSKGTKATNKDDEVVGLCKDKAIRAAEAIGQINDPGATQTVFALKGSRKKGAEFSVSMSHDDKTKDYKVSVEVSRENKWCQIMSVQLTSVPQ